jgi:hypothetical protein
MAVFHVREDGLLGQPVVTPLPKRDSMHLQADYAEETATQYRQHVYAFEDIDVIALEGIYLLKRAFLAPYDLSIWIECSYRIGACYRARPGRACAGMDDASS